MRAAIAGAAAGVEGAEGAEGAEGKTKQNKNRNRNRNRNRIRNISQKDTAIARDEERELLLAYDPVQRSFCRASAGNSLGCDVQAIRVGRYKLILGTNGRGDWWRADSK